MKKILLVTLALTVSCSFAQGISDAQRIYNFSGNLRGGLYRTTTGPQLISGTALTLTSDKFGNANSALSIDGAGTYAKLPGGATGLDSQGKYAIGFWFKKKADSGNYTPGSWDYRPVITIPGTTTPAAQIPGLVFGFTNSGSLFLGYGDASTSTSVQPGNPNNYIATDWNYYFIIKDGTSISLYINNVLADSINVTNYSNFNTLNDIFIGGYKISQTHYGSCEGSLDNVSTHYINNSYSATNISTFRNRIYQEVTGDKNRGTVIKARYDFNGSTTADTYGNFPATEVNEPWLSADRHGNLNSALYVTNGGNAQGIQIPYLNDYVNRGNTTIAFWFKKQGNTTQYKQANYLVTLPNEALSLDSQDSNDGVSLGLGYTVSGADQKIQARAGISSNQKSLITSADTFNNNVWKHCALTTSSTGEMLLYIDGTLYQQLSTSAYPLRTNGGSQNISIGFNPVALPFGSSAFSGFIDEVVIENRVYSATEIADLYSGTLGIDDISIADQIKIYPNPAQSELNISEPANVQIFNILGQKVIELKEVSQINIATLTEGLYIIELEKDGKKKTEKFLKK
jgi:hypothetical protein